MDIYCRIKGALFHHTNGIGVGVGGTLRTGRRGVEKKSPGVYCCEQVEPMASTSYTQISLCGNSIKRVNVPLIQMASKRHMIQGWAAYQAKHRKQPACPKDHKPEKHTT